jgi:hypothetical protein
VTQTARKTKKRILIPIPGDIFIRNFIDSGAFSRLEAEYEIHFLVSSIVKAKIPFQNIHVVSSDQVSKRTHARYLIGYLSMKRFRRRSKTFPIKYRETFYNRLSPAKKAIANALSLPVMAELVIRSREALLGTLPEVDRLIQEIAPDFMVIPSGISDSFSIDCLKSAKKQGIRHLLLMFNWDNVSCKGVLSVVPDHMGVWGEQTHEQAVKIHGLSPKAVHILGSPQFEAYFKPVALSRTEFRSKHALPQDKLIVVYLGVARYRDEIATLSELEKAIAAGQLPDTHILYRPHPWKETYPGERNFFEMGFKHITMDPQLAEHYRNQMTASGYSTKSFVPEYGHYPAMLNAVDAVISSLTTMGIESMLMGKPVLLPVFPDDKHSFSLDTLYEYEHHQCWRKFPDVVVSDRKERFIQDCQRLIGLAKDKRVSQRLREEAKHVVFFDELPYPDRLFRCVQGLIATS